MTGNAPVALVASVCTVAIGIGAGVQVGSGVQVGTAVGWAAIAAATAASTVAWISGVGTESAGEQPAISIEQAATTTYRVLIA